MERSCEGVRLVQLVVVWKMEEKICKIMGSPLRRYTLDPLTVAAATQYLKLAALEVMEVMHTREFRRELDLSINHERTQISSYKAFNVHELQVGREIGKKQHIQWRSNSKCKSDSP